MKLDQLLTPMEAARMKGMSLNLFLYHVGTGSGPQPHVIGAFKHPFFDQADVMAWNHTDKRVKLPAGYAEGATPQHSARSRHPLAGVE